MAPWFPEDASKTGFLIDRLFYLAFTLTAATFVIVLLLLVYFLVRYRARKGQRAYYTKGESSSARWLTAALALTVFLVLDINLAVHDHLAWEKIWKKPDPARVLEIRVKPEQFVWNAEYAGPDGRFDTEDDVKVQNDLHAPVDRPVLVTLLSKDVIHSFFLPQFRIKQDAVPGMETRLSFEAGKTGVFDIACAQHCGLGHYRMHGTLTVDTQEDFAKWLNENAGHAPA